MRTTIHQQAAALAGRRIALVKLIDELYAITIAPVCGKPGKGYKAARKARKQMEQLKIRLADLDTEINNWITQDKKASKDRRTIRLAAYNLATELAQMVVDPQMYPVPFVYLN